MNHREPPHLPAGVRKALHCLSLLLVPALALDEGHAGTRLRSIVIPNTESIPYLPVLGSPSFRIQEALPPPDLGARPAAAAPPVAALSVVESSVAAANTDAIRTAMSPADAQSPAGAVAIVAAPTAPTREPAPILPDSSRPVVHPEDFLPYFQIPGSGRNPNDVNLIVPAVPGAPAPGTLPPSSATYIQTPR